MERFNRKFGGIVILLLANAVFFALYFRFFTGEAVYLYTDIGSDSINSSLPIISMLQRLFAARDFSGFSLNSGIGAPTLVSALKYLNPIKTPLLFFTGDRLPLGLMVELLIQTNVIAFFSWFFFRRLLSHGGAALFASLAWTFSGYITLWSQNLTTGSCMAMFTVMMAALLPVLMKPTVRRCLLLTLSLSLFLLTNYYYCYMSAFYVLVFLIFYSAGSGKTVTQFFISGLEVLGSAVFAVFLAAAPLIPSFTGFSGSGRTNALSVVGSGLKLAQGRELFTLLGRLFSVNSLGTAAEYTGVMNYYEAAALSTTALAVTAVIYLIAVDRTRVITVLAAIVCAASLIVKNTGAFVQFNIGVHRYSFMIVFTSAVAVGFFMKEILTQPYGIPLFWSAIISLALSAAAIFYLATQDAGLGVRTDVRTLKYAGAACLIFSVLVMLYAFGFKISRAVPLLMMLALMAELVVMNYDTVYTRRVLTPAEYAAHMDDGTKEAVSAVQSGDGGLYRISAGSDTDDANIGMLLDFPAASVYSNVNAASLTSLTKLHGTCQLSPNHFLVDGDEFGQAPLLAVRYLIKPNSGLSTDTPSSLLYEKVGETPDGSRVVYRSRAALPFGYLYTDSVSAADIRELPLPERMLTLTDTCYRTDGISTSGNADASTDSSPETDPGESDGGDEPGRNRSDQEGLFTQEDLLDSGKESNHLKLRKTSSGIVFRPTGGDPYIYYNIGKAEKETVRMLYMRLKSTNFNKVRQMQIFFMSAENEDPDPADSRLFFLGRGYPETCIILPDDVRRIRLDFPEDYLDTNVAELSIISAKDIVGMYDGLAKTDITDISMNGGTYRATVSSDKGGTLCVPLLFSGSWRAKVNGDAADVRSINGGLVGIELEKGRSEVVLTWETPFWKAGLAVSAAMVLLFIILFAAAPVLERRARRSR